MFRVVVAGGRSFNDFTLLENYLNFYLSNHLPNVEIVSGVAAGADTLAIEYAKKYKLPVKEFPAQWNLLGKSAGYIRNKAMVDYADACICFWDNKSRGTKHTIDLAVSKGIPVRVVNYRHF